MTSHVTRLTGARFWSTAPHPRLNGGIHADTRSLAIHPSGHRRGPCASEPGGPGPGQFHDRDNHLLDGRRTVQHANLQLPIPELCGCARLQQLGDQQHRPAQLRQHLRQLRQPRFRHRDLSGASSFNIIESFTNTGPTAQTGTFHFSITPGILQNTVNSPLTGGNYVEAGLNFDIKRDGNSIWGSGAALKTDASGTAYTSSGDGTLYAGGGMMYNVLGGSHDIDLGVINAGQTIELSYTLSTYANGDAPAGPPQLVPAQTFVVPDGWYMEGPCKDGYGGYGGYGNLCSQYQPGDVVEIPEHWLSGNPGGSQASSGDPFHVDLAGTDYLVNHYGQNYQGYVSLDPVPEPNQYGMMLGGIGILAWLGRRRRPAETAGR